MHIETLEAVHRESRRLPPIQKVSTPHCVLSGCNSPFRNSAAMGYHALDSAFSAIYRHFNDSWKVLRNLPYRIF